MRIDPNPTKMRLLLLMNKPTEIKLKKKKGDRYLFAREKMPKRYLSPFFPVLNKLINEPSEI